MLQGNRKNAYDNIYVNMSTKDPNFKGTNSKTGKSLADSSSKADKFLSLNKTIDAALSENPPPISLSYLQKAKSLVSDLIESSKKTIEKEGEFKEEDKKVKTLREYEKALADIEELEKNVFTGSSEDFSKLLTSWAGSVLSPPSPPTETKKKEAGQKKNEEEDDEPKSAGDLSGVEPSIKPDKGKDSKEEAELEKKAYQQLEEELSGSTPVQNAVMTLELQEALEEAEATVEQMASKEVRGTPTLTLPSQALDLTTERSAEQAALDDLVVNFLDAADLDYKYKREVFEDLADPKVPFSQSELAKIIQDPNEARKAATMLGIAGRGNKRIQEEEEEARKAAAAVAASSPGSVAPTGRGGAVSPPPMVGPPPPAVGSPTASGGGSATPTVSPTVLGIASTTSLRVLVEGDPVAVPYSQQQLVTEQPFTMEIGSGVKRYHPNSLLCYFGSATSPDWDNELVESVKAMDLTDADVVWFSDTIVSEYGKKIFVKKRLSGTKEELNELMQLQFCVMRNLNKGSRSRTANVKLSDLAKLKEAATASKQGPKVVTPNIPLGASPEEKALIEDEAVNEAVSQNQQPQFVQGADPIAMSVDEAKANFQKVYNERKIDLNGNPLDSVKGTLNTTKVIFGGPMQTRGMFSSPNYIPRDLNLRTKKTRTRGRV